MTKKLKTATRTTVVSTDEHGNMYLPDRAGFDIKKAFTVITQIYNEDENHQKQGPEYSYGFDVCYDTKKLPKNQHIVKDLGNGKAIVTYKRAMNMYKDGVLHGVAIEFGASGMPLSFSSYENGHKVKDDPFQAMNEEEEKPRNDSPATLKRIMLESLSKKY